MLPQKTLLTLRKDGVISIETWKDIVYGEWIERIGQDAFERDLNKWQETPSYRENYTNTEYWEEGVEAAYGGGYNEWNAETTYNQGDIVVLYYGFGYAWMKYTAKKTSKGVCPVTQFYDHFPKVGGFYDSPKRIEKYTKEQIRLSDIAVGYADELLADFEAYRTTIPGIIECVDMNIEHTNLASREYCYIEGHVTKHVTIEGGETVITYSISNGYEKDQDISKTYVSPQDVITDASSQDPEVPSENVYYIKARVRNVDYKSK